MVFLASVFFIIWVFFKKTMSQNFNVNNICIISNLFHHKYNASFPDNPVFQQSLCHIWLVSNLGVLSGSNYLEPTERRTNHITTPIIISWSEIPHNLCPSGQHWTGLSSGTWKFSFWAVNKNVNSSAEFQYWIRTLG